MIVSKQLQQELPPSVLPAVIKMPEDQQASFIAEYNQRKKSHLTGRLLVLLLPGFHFHQLGFSGKRLMAMMLFQATCGGLFVWWVLEFFLHSTRIQNHNQALAMEIMKNIKVLNA